MSPFSHSDATSGPSSVPRLWIASLEDELYPHSDYVSVCDPFIPSLLLTLSKPSSPHYDPAYYHSMIADDNHFYGSVAALGGFALGYTENGQSAYTYSAVPEIMTVNQVGSFFRE